MTIEISIARCWCKFKEVKWTTKTAKIKQLYYGIYYCAFVLLHYYYDCVIARVVLIFSFFTNVSRYLYSVICKFSVSVALATSVAFSLLRFLPE